jgi:membrane protease YdiL (CAAX protease family)
VGLQAQGGTTSRGEVGNALAFSAVAQAASVLESFAFGKDWYPYALLGTVTLQSLPGLVLNVPAAWQGLAAQLGCDALSLGSHALAPGAYFNPLLFNAAHKLSMYGTYALYADLRRRCDDGAYAAAFTGLSLADLAAAPFNAEVLSKPYVWGTIVTVAAVAAATIAGADQSKAPWTTGRSYLGSRELPPWAGFGITLATAIANFTMTAIGEEALYRGTYYEELKMRLGTVPAKLMEANYFTLSHYPQKGGEVARTGFLALLRNYAMSLAMTLWLQCVYDWGGLPASIAVHAWDDVIFGLVDWLLTAGMPYDDDAGFNLAGGTFGQLRLSLTLRL